MSEARTRENTPQVRMYDICWYEKPENVLWFLQTLNEQEYFWDFDNPQSAVKNVLEILESPHKWDPEYKRLCFGLHYNEQFCPICGRVSDEPFIRKYGMCFICDAATDSPDPAEVQP